MEFAAITVIGFGFLILAVFLNSRPDGNLPLSDKGCIKTFIDNWKNNEYWGFWQAKHKIIQAENIVWHFSDETIETIPHGSIKELVTYADEDTPFGACLEESAYGYALVERIFPESNVKMVIGTLESNEDKSHPSHVWLMVDEKYYYINGYGDEMSIPYIYFWMNYTEGSVEYKANETNIYKYACE